MSNVHIVVDMIRMWLLVRIHKKAGIKSHYVYLLFLFEAKYKFIGVARHFNDCFMVLAALGAIHAL